MHDKCQFILRHYKYAHAISLSIGLGWIILIVGSRRYQVSEIKVARPRFEPRTLATPLLKSMCRRRKRTPPPKKKKSVATDKLKETYPPPYELFYI